MTETNISFTNFRYLQMAFDETIRRQDFRTVLTNVANNPEGKQLAFAAMFSRWDTLLEW